MQIKIVAAKSIKHFIIKIQYFTWGLLYKVRQSQQTQIAFCILNPEFSARNAANDALDEKGNSLNRPVMARSLTASKR